MMMMLLRFCLKSCLAACLCLIQSSDPGETSPTPPASPPTYRRTISREENPNVFSRLTHGTNVGQEPVPDRGVVHPFQGKVRSQLIAFESFFYYLISLFLAPFISMTRDFFFMIQLSNKSPLICTRTAEGHCQAVLSICATDSNLFSASKGKTTW